MEAIKKLDKLNRICLPYQMRTVLDITTGSRLKVIVGDEEIHLTKACDNGIITRPIDDVGRVILNKGMMAALGAVKYSHIRLTCIGGELILRPALPRCKLCGSEGDLLEYKEGLYVCRDCLDNLKSL